MPTSIRMISGRNSSAASTASRPSCAVRTSFPSSLSTLAKRRRRVPVVVHHQDAPPRAAARPARLRVSRGALGSRAALQGGKPDGERAALSRAGALGRDGPAVHLDQPLHKRQPDAEPARRALDAPVHLGEHVEDAGQCLGGDADPVVADRDDDVLAPPLGGEPDVAARARCTWRCWSAGC